MRQCGPRCRPKLLPTFHEQALIGLNRSSKAARGKGIYWTMTEAAQLLLPGPYKSMSKSVETPVDIDEIDVAPRA